MCLNGQIKQGCGFTFADIVPVPLWEGNIWMKEVKQKRKRESSFLCPMMTHQRPWSDSNLHFYARFLRLYWDWAAELQLVVGRRRRLGFGSIRACLGLKRQLWEILLLLFIIINNQRMLAISLCEKQKPKSSSVCSLLLPCFLTMELYVFI